MTSSFSQALTGILMEAMAIPTVDTDIPTEATVTVTVTGMKTTTIMTQVSLIRLVTWHMSAHAW